MNPIERAIRRVDAAQQRHKAPAFVFGIIKKYGDDNGGVLAANLAHSGFVFLVPAAAGPGDHLRPGRLRRPFVAP
jgi:hypothetical protein